MDSADTPWIRAFLALELPDDVRAALARLQGRLQRTRAQVGWVPPDNFHVSLAFLGDVTPGQFAALESALRPRLAGLPPLALTVRGLGTFGRPDAPRVLWARVEGPPELADLHARLLAVLREQELRVESRAFRPHITLGRVRAAGGRAALLEAMAQQAETVCGGFTATQVAGMQSVLEPTRPHYVRRFVVAWGGARTSA